MFSIWYIQNLSNVRNKKNCTRSLPEMLPDLQLPNNTGIFNNNSNNNAINEIINELIDKQQE